MRFSADSITITSGIRFSVHTGAGNDFLDGGAGSNNYLFDRGGGQDLIMNGVDSNSNPTGVLRFGSDIATNQLWFSRSGDDLTISILGTQDKITVLEWFDMDRRRLQDIRAGGLEVDSGVSQLVQAMATYSTNNASFNPTLATQAPTDAALQSAIAAAWH